MILPAIDNKDQLFNIISKGKEEFPEAEMVLLHQLPRYLLNNPSLHERIFNIKKKNFSQCLLAPIGNQLFYITNEGIRVLLNELNPVTIPADFPQDVLAKQGKLIITNYPLCTHNWGTDGITYIGNQYRGSSRKFIP